MILLIDNYDSFTFNLYQYLGELGEEVIVYRNNQIHTTDIKQLKPKAIILSPGPGRPENAGICMEVIQTFYKDIPILGICLGHQAIGAAFGGKIKRASIIKHGKTSFIHHNRSKIFHNLSENLEVMRYHSLIIEKNTIPEELECIAYSKDDQEIMAIKHKHYPVYGLQFHPESIGTPTGKQILENFLCEIEGMRKNEEISASIG
ncbi:aminodeoxychorismate/anthranilate synthase component II [Neobacillus sedimentimangrovi]|uniref:Aminodeoxychorismate/anthranilate synthase component II n=1 Tax=Neobacillus sedimentimangrovi TaxID=2699460 RepID=A0ABS8QHZ7_9BACI|nr:aminodeoxychorismate/anthranilate synthase component II [Neobacillus sedimentimangrovi]AIM15304.1 anthranilate synthase subunit II [Bacillus sp. X1(2014)]MCD4838800.1 aminodeoxychorismate/anthranilate synthase component II [Neobacillus sedimentimangrovi]